MYNDVLAPISAEEWNAFCVRINEFLNYKELPEFSFTSVASGTPIAKEILLEAATAISGISGAGALPTVYDVLSSGFWQQLAGALNSIL